MKNLFKKVVCGSLCFVLAIASLTGCGNKNSGNSQSGATGDFKFGEDELNFSWYLNYDYMAAKPWAEDSQIEQWIKDNKKVNIKYMDPGGAASQRMVTMIASNSLPDAILMERNQDVDKMVSSGLLVSLDEYMDKYTYTKNDLGQDIINMLKSSDGKVYQMPNWANSAGNPNGINGWAINTKVRKELGNPRLQTFDDLYKYLKNVKEKYPDMIPIVASSHVNIVDSLYQGYQDGESFPLNYKEMMLGYPKNGKFESTFESDAYKNAILYVSKIFREGLLSKDTFTQTDDQIKEKLKNGRVAVFVGDVNTANVSEEDMEKQGSGWEYILPLCKEGKNQSEVMLESFDRLGWNSIVISKNAKNPEGIFAYLDWLYSPFGQVVYNYGPKGIYWDELNENKYPILKPKFFEKPHDTLKKEMQGSGSASPLGNTSWVDGCAKYVYDQTAEEKRDWTKGQQYNVIWKTSKDRTEFSNIVPKLSTEEGLAYQTIGDSYKEVVAKMVFAETDAEVLNLLNGFITETKSSGIDGILKVMTENWNKNKQNLGIN